MNDLETGLVEVNGYKLRYHIEGHGTPALVIGSSKYYPRSFSKNLRKHLRLIFVDWRGFSASNDTVKSDALSLDILLDDIDRVREALKLNHVVVMGHSIHALMALEYAKKYPQHVSAVVMIGIGPNIKDNAKEAADYWNSFATDERKAAFEKRKREYPDEKLATLAPDHGFVQWYIRRDPEAWYDFNFDSSYLWEDAMPNMALFDFAYQKAFWDFDITEGLKDLKSPVFLALGRYDFIVGAPSMWDAVKPQFQNLTVHVFEKSGHSPQLEEAALFDEALLNWLHPT